MEIKKHKIAIIGSGPAGLAAAIYTSRAQIDTTIYAGEEFGGLLTKTTEIENYPGVMGKTGPELMLAMTSQAQKFGTKIMYESVAHGSWLMAHGKHKLVSESGEKEFDAVILAMGASPRLLGVGEEKYWGKGFSTCAVCDAAFYKGKNVYVVGGGDAAIEDAMALTKFARNVTIVVRRDKLRASVAMQKRILDNPTVKILWNSEVEKINGVDKVESLVINGETVGAEGLFFAIGHIPATGWLKGSDVKLDENGYIDLQGDSLKVWPTMTSVAGVFAAGDCSDHRYRQAATAVGMGVQAALDIERWLACLPAGRRQNA